MRTRSLFVPALIEGDVAHDAAPPGQAVAIAVDGRIAATTRLFDVAWNDALHLARPRRCVPRRGELCRRVRGSGRRGRRAPRPPRRDVDRPRPDAGRAPRGASATGRRRRRWPRGERDGRGDRVCPGTGGGHAPAGVSVAVRAPRRAVGVRREPARLLDVEGQPGVPRRPWVDAPRRRDVRAAPRLRAAVGRRRVGGDRVARLANARRGGAHRRDLVLRVPRRAADRPAARRPARRGTPDSARPGHARRSRVSQVSGLPIVPVHLLRVAGAGSAFVRRDGSARDRRRGGGERAGRTEHAGGADGDGRVPGERAAPPGRLDRREAVPELRTPREDSVLVPAGDHRPRVHDPGSARRPHGPAPAQR